MRSHTEGSESSVKPCKESDNPSRDILLRVQSVRINLRSVQNELIDLDLRPKTRRIQREIKILLNYHDQIAEWISDVSKSWSTYTEDMKKLEFISDEAQRDHFKKFETYYFRTMLHLQFLIKHSADLVAYCLQLKHEIFCLGQECESP